MLIRSSELMGPGLLFAGAFCAFEALHSLKTGTAMVWVMPVERAKQPISFRISVYTSLILSAASFALAALFMLGIGT